MIMSAATRTKMSDQYSTTRRSVKPTKSMLIEVRLLLLPKHEPEAK